MTDSFKDIPFQSKKKLGDLTSLTAAVSSHTAQLIDNAKINKTCSSLGLIAGNISEAANNYTKLTNAMNVGYRIVVDNDYYISGSTAPVINKDISLLGVSGSLTLTTNTTSISFSRNLQVDGVKFVCGFTGTPSYLFVNSTNDAIDLIKFINNEYIGNISTLKIDRVSFQTPTKIKSFVFENNKLSNRLNLWIYLNVLDFDSIDIFNNKIRNMDMQIFNINNSTNSKAVINIKGNSVVNDFDLWVAAPSSYLCFVLYVGGGKVVYKNNEVKGLKTKVGVANVYDNYISCDSMDYENNIWEDNITVSPTRGKNGLFKGKTGNSPTVYRNCRNNKFHMSKELIDSLTQAEKDQCHVTLWDFSSPISKFTYEGNDVDVYNIAQNEFDDALLFKFQNNNIYAQKITGYIINFDPVAGSRLIVNKNTVKSLDSTPYSFYGESTTSGTVLHDEIIMENNTISMAFTQLLYTPKAKKLTLNNNVIENLNPATSSLSLMHLGKIGKLAGTNNKINSLTDMALTRSLSTLGELDFGVEINRSLYNYASNTFPITFDATKEQMKQVSVNYNLLTKTEQCLFNLFFEFGTDGTGFYVKYKDASDVMQTKYVDGTYTASVVKINTFTFAVAVRIVMDTANKIVSFRVDAPPQVVEKFQVKSFTTLLP